jgi:hypothetical protein
MTTKENEPKERESQETKKKSLARIILSSIAYGVIGVPLACHIIVHMNHGYGMNDKEIATSFIFGIALSVVLIFVRLALR